MKMSPKRKHRLSKGLIHVYTGGGKGKTTAALGLAMRAVGHGMRAIIIQFMKGRINYGELAAARRFGRSLSIIQTGRPSFVRRKDPDPVDVVLAQAGIRLAKKAIGGGQYDVVVLDEINCALDYGLVSLDQVIRLIKLKPGGVEMVLTGRKAHPAVKKLAHLVTEMREMKHYFTKGVHARRGIEW